MESDDYLTVKYSRIEAIAAGAAMRAVLQTAINSGAIPPAPLARAAYKLAIEEVRQHPELGVDLTAVEGSDLAKIVNGEPQRARRV